MYLIKLFLLEDNWSLVFETKISASFGCFPKEHYDKNMHF